jgi:preprotein translocase subunit SecG
LSGRGSGLTKRLTKHLKNVIKENFLSFMLSAVLVLQVLAALGVIILVLLQHGKGADMGAAFGSGSSGSLFGASGSANFLSRVTGALAAVFFVCTLVLAFMSQRPGTRSGGGSVMDEPASSGQIKSPAAPVVPAIKSDIPSAPAATGTPEVPKADAAKVDSAKPDTQKPETLKPEAAKSDAEKPAQGGGIPK